MRWADSEANSAASPIRLRVVLVGQGGQVEDVVVDGDDGPSGQPDVAAPEHPHRVLRRRPVEGLRHRRAPVEQQRIVIVVEKTDTADVRRLPVDGIEAAETQSALHGEQLIVTTGIRPGEGLAFGGGLVGAGRRTAVGQSEILGGRAVASAVENLVQHGHIALFLVDLVLQHGLGHALF